MTKNATPPFMPECLKEIHRLSWSLNNHRSVLDNPELEQLLCIAGEFQGDVTRGPMRLVPPNEQHSFLLWNLVGIWREAADHTVSGITSTLVFVEFSSWRAQNGFPRRGGIRSWKPRTTQSCTFHIGPAARFSDASSCNTFSLKSRNLLSTFSYFGNDSRHVQTVH